MSQKNEIIRDAIREKAKHGDFANKTLAREIISNNPHLFEDSDLESVRSLIRKYRGANGEHNRKTSHKKIIAEAQRDPTKVYEYLQKFSKRSVQEKTEDWHLPMNNATERVLILSDVHLPYHDLDALQAAVHYGIQQEITAIYLNGDIVDFADISRWTKPVGTPSVKVEKEMLIEFLTWLNELDVPIYYKLGNHEDRWRHYLLRQAPEFAADEYFTLEHYLSVKHLVDDWIDSSQKAYFGKLMVLHGHEFGQSLFSPVNPARGLFLRAKCSVLAGHNHQSSYHAENTANEHEIGCWSTGCLSTLKPEYRPMAYTKWNHGAAIVTVNEDRTYHVDNFRIMKGKIV
jgi:predicted phosphodiesterase